MTIEGNYPLATSDGAAIPFHVIRPIALGRIDFTATPSAVIAIGSVDDVATLYATTDCLIRFGSAVSVPVSGAQLLDTLYLPAGFVVSAQYTDNGLSVVQVSSSGTLWIQLHQKWQLIRSSLASTRR